MGQGVVQLFRILVVDDFEDFRRFVSSVLQQSAEFQVTEASNGLEAVQKAEELQPDLILLDIGLPNLNGLEVAKRVRELAPAAKIVFLSVESSPDIVREALAVGARGYVHKSRCQTDLLPAIKAVLRGKQYVGSGLEFGTNAQHPRRHEVQFYSADSVVLESFARFVATALEAGDAAIVLATKSHQEGLVQRWKTEGFDIDSAIRQETYISIDAAEMLLTIMVNGVPDVVRFFKLLCGLIESAAKATKKEHPRIAFCGECVGLLCAEGNTNAAIRLEEACNDLVQKYNADILCAYPLSSFDCAEDDLTFKRICAEHTAVYSS